MTMAFNVGVVRRERAGQEMDGSLPATWLMGAVGVAK